MKLPANRLVCQKTSAKPLAAPAPPPGGGGGWFVYILRCADGTFYTGVTTDPVRRLREHNAGGKLGARYTRARRPVALIHQEPAASRAEACRREAAIKKLSREAKLSAFLPSPPGGGAGGEGALQP